MPITEPTARQGPYTSHRSEADFRALVDRYLPLVYAAAVRHTRGNATLAQDIAQDVFIALAAKTEVLESRPTLAPWLFTATRLAALNRLRGEQRRLEREQEAYTVDSISAETKNIDWAQTRPLIDDLLATLRSRDQEAIFMRFFEGRTFAEIGALLKIGEDSARQRSNRALEKLRSLLARRGVRSSSGVLAGVLTTQFAGATPPELASMVTSVALATSTAAPAASLLTASIILPAMNASKIAFCSLALVAIGGIGGTLYNAQSTQNAEATAASLQGEHAALRAEMNELTRQLHAERSRAAQSAVTVTNARLPAGPGAKPHFLRTAGSSSAASSTSTPPSSVTSLVDQIDHVLAHPELRPAFVQQVVQQLWGEDRRFFKIAGVSLQQEEAIRQEAAAYASMLLQARANRIGGENFNELFAAADEHSFAQVERILGTDTFTQLKEYKAHSGENRAVDRLATQLYFTDTPLTGTQANQLTEILTQNRFAADQASRQVVAGRVISSAEYAVFRSSQTGPHVALITDAAVVLAQGTLPAATVAALQNLQASQSAQIQLTRTSTPVK